MLDVPFRKNTNQRYACPPGTPLGMTSRFQLRIGVSPVTLGVCVAQVMDMGSALRDCDKCIELKPEFPRAYARKATVEILCKQVCACALSFKESQSRQCIRIFKVTSIFLFPISGQTLVVPVTTTHPAYFGNPNTI